jgi:hypothetical protein
MLFNRAIKGNVLQDCVYFFIKKNSPNALICILKLFEYISNSNGKLNPSCESCMLGHGIYMHVIIYVYTKFTLVNNQISVTVSRDVIIQFMTLGSKSVLSVQYK